MNRENVVTLVAAAAALGRAGLSPEAVAWIVREAARTATRNAPRRPTPEPILYCGNAPTTDMEVAHAAGYSEMLGEQHDAGEHDKAPHPQCHFCPVEGPEPGTLAFSARMFAETGLMTGEEADMWKDEMKDRALFGDD